jgi:hypothetical protein
MRTFTLAVIRTGTAFYRVKALDVAGDFSTAYVGSAELGEQPLNVHPKPLADCLEDIARHAKHSVSTVAAITAAMFGRRP